MNIIESSSQRLHNACLGLLLCAACGCGGAGGGAVEPDGIDADAFIGDWRYVTGSVVTSCPGAPQVSVATTGETTSVLRGAQADLTLPLDGCTLNLDIEADTAHSIAPATCTVVEGNFTVTVTITAYSLTMNDDATLTEAGSGTSRVEANGQSVSCTAAISGRLEKL